MIIIGVDYHPGFQQIAFVERIQGKSQVANTAEEKSIGGLQIRAAKRIFPVGRTAEGKLGF